MNAYIDIYVKKKKQKGSNYFLVSLFDFNALSKEDIFHFLQLHFMRYFTPLL